MAGSLEQHVSDLIANQDILDNYPDDYKFHPLNEPLAAKVDGELMIGVLARENGQDGAEFNQLALMTLAQYSEFLRDLPDAKPNPGDSAAKETVFTGKQVWQNVVTAETLPEDEYSKVFYRPQNGRIVQDAVAMEANGEWARNGIEPTPRPYNEVLLPEGRNIGEVLTDEELLVKTDWMGEFSEGRILYAESSEETELEVPEGYARYYYNVETQEIAAVDVAKSANADWDMKRDNMERPFDFAILPNDKIEDGVVSKEDLEHKLSGDYQLVEERLSVLSNDGAIKLDASNFLFNNAHDIRVHAEMVNLGREPADLSLSSSDIGAQANIYIEQGYQPRQNVVEIPQALLDAVHNPPAEEQNPVELSNDFNQAAPAEPNYQPRPDVTVVDTMRAEYQKILDNGKSDYSQISDINREIGGALLRYLGRDRNFEDQDPQFLKDEIHEAIDDLKSLGLGAQAEILEQYEANVNGGMDPRDARDVAKEALDDITEQARVVNLEQQGNGVESEAERRAAYIAEKELQDRLEKDAISKQWMSEAFETLSQSDEAAAYKNALHSGEGVEEAKANLDQLVDKLKAESFPDHKSIDERRAERDIEPEAVNGPLREISAVIEAAFLEKMQEAGIDPVFDGKQQAAFAAAVMDGISEDSVRDKLSESPEDAKQELADGIISRMGEAIDELKQGLYDRQDGYRETITGGVQGVINSPEFQLQLEERLGDIKAAAMEQGQEAAQEYLSDLHREAHEKVEQAREAAANPEHEALKQQNMNVFKNFSYEQRQAMLDGLLQKESESGSLDQQQQVIKDALMELQEQQGTAPQPAAGIKP